MVGFADWFKENIFVPTLSIEVMEGCQFFLLGWVFFILFLSFYLIFKEPRLPDKATQQQKQEFHEKIPLFIKTMQNISICLLLSILYHVLLCFWFTNYEQAENGVTFLGKCDFWLKKFWNGEVLKTMILGVKNYGPISQESVASLLCLGILLLNWSYLRIFYYMTNFPSWCGEILFVVQSRVFFTTSSGILGINKLF